MNMNHPIIHQLIYMAGLTPGLLRVIHRQIGQTTKITQGALSEKWRGVCLNQVDLDHLLATPIFDPCRCSIGFHVLHSWYMIAVYVLLLFSRLRILGIGLLMHMLTDQIDCWMQGYYCA